MASGPGSSFSPSSSLAGQHNLEPIAPLELYVIRWTPASLAKKCTEMHEDVDRKIRALLNKLTMELFDSISDHWYVQRSFIIRIISHRTLC